MATARKVRELESRVGHQFKNRELLRRALTHASVRQQGSKRRDNERLEFLGDRVLGLAIAELLTELYPAANEGQLARLYNRLVRGGTCAEIARSLDLGPSLVLSEAEAGRRIADGFARGGVAREGQIRSPYPPRRGRAKPTRPWTRRRPQCSPAVRRPPGWQWL